MQKKTAKSWIIQFFVVPLHTKCAFRLLIITNMIYKLVFSCEEVDDFRRVYEADGDATFLELHQAILQSVGYADD